MFVSSHGGAPWYLTSCYGYPQAFLLSALWEGLRIVASLVRGPWCIVGDFNVIVFDYEVKGSSSSYHNCHLLGDCTLNCNMFDAGF